MQVYVCCALGDDELYWMNIHSITKVCEVLLGFTKLCEFLLCVMVQCGVLLGFTRIHRVM